MSEKASQLRIGIFVIVGVAILLGALFLFGIRSAFQPTYKLETYVMGAVQGLSVGSVVKLRGVEVGKVTQIGFSWNLYETLQPACVVVRFEVKQAISPEMFRKDFDDAVTTVVNNGLRATVELQGITGTSVLALETLDPKKYPPLQFPWKPKYPYVPSAPSQIGQIACLDRDDALEPREVRRREARQQPRQDSAVGRRGAPEPGRPRRQADLAEAVDTLASAEAAIREVEGARHRRADDAPEHEAGRRRTGREPI